MVCFSVKSNSNINVLRELKKIGSGADVVSSGELLKSIKAGINVKKIVFSGVGKTEDEIKLAIKKKVLLINMESENEAILINKISNKMNIKTSVGIRLNPNIIGKTHKKISTGGKHDKFGLSYKDCIDFCKKINSFKNLKLDGLSVHIGSQITSIKPFQQVLGVLDKLIKETNINFKFIDLGGGMGISYDKKEKKLNLNKYSQLVFKFVKNKKTQIIFEPGRFIIGNSSILISKIIYIKKSNKKKFIILDAGMNDLMRPALYNAYHKILPLIKRGKKIIKNIEFVGPICESTDKFATLKKYQTILNIEATWFLSSQISNPKLSGEEKILDLVKKLGGTSYVNASGGAHLYSKDLFLRNNIELKFLCPWQGSHLSILEFLAGEESFSEVRKDIFKQTRFTN